MKAGRKKNGGQNRSFNTERQPRKLLPGWYSPPQSTRFEPNPNVIYPQPVAVPSNVCMVCRKPSVIATILQAKNPRVQVRVCKSCTVRLGL